MISVAAVQNSFVRYLAWMEKTARLAFRNLDAEKRAEEVSNVIALAWKAWVRLGERGRADNPLLLKSVLYYSIRQSKVGRTVCSAAKPRDPLALRVYGKVKFDPWNLADFVGKETPIPEQVSFRVDVPAFLATLSPRQRQMALDLAEGGTTSAVAKKYDLSPGRISQFRREFKVLFDSYFSQ
jgi:hypothetical protein